MPGGATLPPILTLGSAVLSVVIVGMRRPSS